MNNWLWIALGIGALALFAFGRGGCGMGHGGHGRGHRDEGSPDREPMSGARSTPAKADATTPTTSTAEHANGAPLVGPGALEHAGHGSVSQQAEPRRHRHGC